MVWWWLLACLWGTAAGVSVDPDVNELSLLPLHKLMAVKRSLKHNMETTPAAYVNQSASPGALPLRGRPLTADPGRRGGPPMWAEEVEVWKGGGGHGHTGNKGKLSAIFQGTVTTLAFLAFGGYLLCLILHVFKEKKAALTMTLLTTVAPTTRRRRRAARREGDMYLALRRLAEGYARYNHHHHQEL